MGWRRPQLHPERTLVKSDCNMGRTMRVKGETETCTLKCVYVAVHVDKITCANVLCEVHTCKSCALAGVQRLARRDRRAAMFLQRWSATILIGNQMRDVEQASLARLMKSCTQRQRSTKWTSDKLCSDPSYVSRVPSDHMTECLLSNCILQYCASPLVSAPSHSVPSEGLLQKRSEFSPLGMSKDL